MNRKSATLAWRSVALMALAAVGCGRGADTATLNELQRVKTATLSIVLLSSGESLRQGKDTFTIEFRAISDNQLVDVGEVRGSASMSMAGTPMFGSVEVQRTSVPGRYTATSDFSMAGRWRLALEWNGPAGPGSVNFTGAVL